MATTNTYLTFDGNCEEAFGFYRSVFGGEFDRVARFSDMPPEESSQVSAEDKNKIMHISLPIGGSVLMGSDTGGGEWATSFIQGNNFSISVSADNKAEVQKLFSGLAASGQITMPLADTFWGAYFGMIVDQFGINWMVSCDEKKVKE